MISVKSTLQLVPRWLEANKLLLLRIAFVILALVFSIYLVPKAVQGILFPALLLFLYLGILGLLVLLRWPVLGLIVIVMAGGMFVPISGPSGFNISIIGVAMLLGLWILDMLVRQRRFQIVASRTFLPLVVFFIISTLSFIVGQIPWFSFAKQAPLEAQLGGFAIFVLSMGAFLLVANIVNNLNWLQALTWSFIALGTMYIAGRLLHLGIEDRIYRYGFTNGSIFWTWLVALTFGQAAFNTRLQNRWRLALAAIVAATFYVAFFQAYDWKSGWLPPLVAVAAMLGFRYWRRTVFLAPLGLFLTYLVITKSIGSDEYSYGTRLDAWFIVLEIVKASPILGLGFANYYWITPLFPIRGYRVVFNSHSQYVDLIAETGILGLACFLWFFWEVGRLGWWLRERVPAGFPRGYVYGALGGVVGTLAAAALVDWVLPFVYNIGLNGFRASIIAWIFMGGLVSLEQMVRNQQGVEYAG